MRRVVAAALLAVALSLGASVSAQPRHHQPLRAAAHDHHHHGHKTDRAARLVRHRLARLRRRVADGRHPAARPRIDGHGSRPHDAVVLPRPARLGARPGAVSRSGSGSHHNHAAAQSAAAHRGRRAAATSTFRSRGIVAFVNNEILTEVESGTPAQYLNVVARRLHLTLLETQSFTLSGRTLQRWRIDGNANVRATLGRLQPFGRISAQPNTFTSSARRSRRCGPTPARNTSCPSCT